MITALPGLDTPLLFLLEGGRPPCSKPFPFLGKAMCTAPQSSPSIPNPALRYLYTAESRSSATGSYPLTRAVSSLSPLCALTLEPGCLSVGAFPSMSSEIRADLSWHGHCSPGVTPVRRPRLSCGACSRNLGSNDLPTARTLAAIYYSFSTASRQDYLSCFSPWF